MGYVRMCVNPDCKYVRNYGFGGGHDDFCPICKGDLISECRECGHPISTVKAVYCGSCKRPLKGTTSHEVIASDPQKGQ